MDLRIRTLQDMKDGTPGKTLADADHDARMEKQNKVIDLMRASSCFGREVCLSAPCACAQSLIDAANG